MRPFVRSRQSLVFTALVLATVASRAEAAIGFKADGGWEVSFDGFVNAFGVNEVGSTPPALAAADPLMTTSDVSSFRVRTGLLPGLFGFNVIAPKSDGIALAARVGLYPQINNGGSRTAFGSQLDVRELYFTAEGRFGQVLLGRALNLYQGKNILTDMTLFGVGVQGGVASNGTTLGRIGYGYLYSQFGGQMRYTTPTVAGLKLAVAVVDPSRISGGGVDATETTRPGFEGELSYAAKLRGAALSAWVSGLHQQARVPGGAEKTAVGGAAGVSASLGGVDLLASGFLGEGLGSFLLLDVDSLDAAGVERRGRGYMLQAAYRFLGRTKAGLSFGQNTMDETSAERAAREAGGDSPLETRRSVTGGLYHDLNKHLKVVAEYTWAESAWFGGQDQAVNVVALGGFFSW